MNQYFVPGFGISRLVIQREIKFHLGPETIVRPYIHQGRDGFLVSTPGGPPTQAQIEDIQHASQRFEQQQAARASTEGARHNHVAFVNAPVRIFHAGGRR